jgi:tight adherence protein B
MLNIIMLMSFTSVFLISYQILKYRDAKKRPINRLEAYTPEVLSSVEKRRKSNRAYRSGIGLMAKGIKNLKFLDGYKKSLQLQLNKASILLKAEEYLTFVIIIVAGAGLITYILTASIFSAFLMSAAGLIIPRLIVKSRIKKRVKNLNEQLGDAITVISNSLKAGYSFFQSINIVVREMSGPISEEFSILEKEISLGLPVENALDNLVKRASSEDLELVVTAVLIQRQVGGNLAEVLDSISSTIRDRIKIKGEVKTITAQGRISGLIISLLPLILGILIYMINPEHMSILFKNKIGILIIVFSVVMQMTGIYFISRIVKIEV